jgi:FLYWCH zinc finger domain
MDSVISKRGKRKLVHENHVYVFSKKTKDSIHGIWVCEKRSSCNGRVWTQEENGEIVKVVTPHNHAAQAARPQALQMICQMKERARTSLEQPQQIVSTSVAGVHADVAALLPRKDSLKRTIRNARNDNGIPALPRNVEELMIPEVCMQFPICNCCKL